MPRRWSGEALACALEQASWSRRSEVGEEEDEEDDDVARIILNGWQSCYEYYF